MFNHRMPLDRNSKPVRKLGLLQFARVCLISPGEACGVRGQMGPLWGCLTCRVHSVVPDSLVLHCVYDPPWIC